MKPMKERRLNRDSLDFADGKISRLFRKIFFPTLIGMIFMTAQTVVDGIFVGRGVGSGGMASVNIVAPFWMVATGIGLMFSVGASVIASIRLAEHNVKAARIIMTQAFVMGFVLLVPVMALCLALPREMVRLLGCSPALEHNAIDYLVWILPGLVFLYMQCVGMLLVRLDGSPKYAMWVQIASVVVNMVLDWWFIFPLGLGVKGAAMATSVACIVGGVMVVVYFVWFSSQLRFYRLKLTLTSLLLTLRNAWYMVKLGFATFLSELAMSVMMFTGNMCFMRMLGDAGVGAFALACYLFPVVFSIGVAVAQSAQPIISFNYGAHRPDRVARALRISLVAAAVSGLTVTLLLVVGSRHVTGLFLSPADPAYPLAMSGVPLFALCAAFFSINYTFIGYYQSIERPGIAALYTLLRGIVLLVASFLLLPRVLGAAGLWLSIPVAEALTCVIIVGFFAICKHRGAPAVK